MYRMHPLLLISLAVFVGACGIQSIPQAQNGVEASLAEVMNQYKRRADLVPNLVATVKGYASHERETLDAVTSARARATSLNVDPSKLSSEQLTEFQSRQGELSQALGRLLMVSERYPDLKANQNFRDLQVQLEGTENRITIARQRNIEAIRHFNNLVTVPPTSWTNAIFYRHSKLPQWSVSEQESEQIQQAPDVSF